MDFQKYILKYIQRFCYIKYIAYICIVIKLVTNKECATLKFQNHAKNRI